MTEKELVKNVFKLLKEKPLQDIEIYNLLTNSSKIPDSLESRVFLYRTLHRLVYNEQLTFTPKFLYTIYLPKPIDYDVEWSTNKKVLYFTKSPISKKELMKRIIEEETVKNIKQIKARVHTAIQHLVTGKRILQYKEGLIIYLKTI